MQARHLRRAAIGPFALAAIGMVALAHGALAQDAAKKPPPPAKVVPGNPVNSANAPIVTMPDAEKVVLLVRSTMLTLNDALQTNNFTVLRERGSPNFQNSATAQELANAFAQLRSLQIDLIGVSVSVPQLVAPPTIDAQSRLRIIGFYPGQGVQFNFDLQYEPVAGQWRLFSMAVNTSQPQVAAHDAPATPAPVPPTRNFAPSDPSSIVKKK